MEDRIKLSYFMEGKRINIRFIEYQNCYLLKNISRRYPWRQKCYMVLCWIVCHYP